MGPPASHRDEGLASPSPSRAAHWGPLGSSRCLPAPREYSPAKEVQGHGVHAHHPHCTHRGAVSAAASVSSPSKCQTVGARVRPPTVGRWLVHAAVSEKLTRVCLDAPRL